MVDIKDMVGPWWEHLRLALLRALVSECRDGRGHESLLVDLVNAVYIAADRDQVRDTLIWLHGQKLVQVDIVAEAMVARITERGQDVAAGRAVVAGVKEPSAGRAAKSVAELLAAAQNLKPS